MQHCRFVAMLMSICRFPRAAVSHPYGVALLLGVKYGAMFDRLPERALTKRPIGAPDQQDASARPGTGSRQEPAGHDHELT
jgi:hypothetical protein